MPRSPVLALVWLACGVAVAEAQTGANVLVVANEAVPASVEIAQAYVYRRAIPGEHLLTIRTGTADEISRAEFDRDIRAPLAAWFARHAAHDRILYIVLTKGVPLRIAGTTGRRGTVASVDSELTLLYRHMAGVPVAPNGPTPNPYFLGEAAIGTAARFTHVNHDIYLVTRLDGFTLSDVHGLIDRGAEAAGRGRVLLDQRASLEDKPNEWLAAAATRLTAAGHEAVLENTSRVLQDETEVLGYYSWGSNDPAITTRQPAVTFAPGALAAMFVSTDARTFSEPPADWKPGRWESRQAYYAGSPQSLTGDLIRAGATGVAGYVAEPFLDGSVRPDILFPAYYAGFNLAEAFYLALPSLGWQAVVVGDPLASPFARDAIPGSAVNPPVDKDTELSERFTARWLAASNLQSDNPMALKLVLRSEVRMARNDLRGAREALEEAVALDDSLTEAWRGLGGLYEQLGEPSKAVAVNRKLVDRNPKDVVALNNLAYALAVRENKPAEALPLAERALLLAPRNALVADTVGWIKHLLGDNAGAARLLGQAAKALESNVDVRLHFAVVLAELGHLDQAAAQLKAIASIDPAATDRPEYQDVQLKIRR